MNFQSQNPKARFARGTQAGNLFRQLKVYSVIEGGVHTDGFTENALVIIADWSYLELISFTNPPSHYPPSSPRHTHKWASRAPGWIDYAFLGNGILRDPNGPGGRGPPRISDMVNQRWAGLYRAEVPGGRTRPDGVRLEWVISAPAPVGVLQLPFFCGDVTDRRKRVPAIPIENTVHPSGVQGVSHIRILVSRSDFSLVADQINAVVDAAAFERTDGEAKWHLSTLNGRRSPTLILSVPVDEEEVGFVQERGSEPGIYEVAFWVEEGGKEGSAVSPFGRIVWVK